MLKIKQAGLEIASCELVTFKISALLCAQGGYGGFGWNDSGDNFNRFDGFTGRMSFKRLLFEIVSED